MSAFKVWPCRKRWPKMRPVISTMRVDHVEWLAPFASVGMEHEAADEFDKRLMRAMRATQSPDDSRGSE